MEENKQVIEERTLEEVLLELRESKNYTYLDITEKLNQKETYIEEKIINSIFKLYINYYLRTFSYSHIGISTIYKKH